MNLPPITIDDIFRQHKRSHYTPDLIQATISVAFENSVSTLNTPSNSTGFLTFNDHNTLHVMKKYEPYLGKVKIGYCYRKHDKKDATKIQGSIASYTLKKTRNFIPIMGFSSNNSETRNLLLEH